MIVSNATPLITFARIGRLDLLMKVTKNLVIPTAVHHEISVYGKQPIKEDWITVKAVHSMERVRLLLPVLDQGESEVVALALETQAKLVLLDELTGRKVAQSLNLPVIGSVGILMRAKHMGEIKAVKPFLELMTEQGIYFSRNFINQVLQNEGE